MTRNKRRRGGFIPAPDPKCVGCGSTMLNRYGDNEDSTAGLFRCLDCGGRSIILDPPPEEIRENRRAMRVWHRAMHHENRFFEA